MSDICLIVVWFGPWPDWINFFLKSCRLNAGIKWIIFTSNTAPAERPSNVDVVNMDQSDFESRVSAAIGSSFKLAHGYKLCDLKPLYGQIFSDLITKYKFWGYCDVDVIFGNLDAFLVPTTLQNADIITSSNTLIAGHFTILRNTIHLKQLYRQCPDWLSVILDEKHRTFDEKDFNSLVLDLAQRAVIRLARVPMVSEDALIWWSGRSRFLILWNRGRLFDVACLRPLGYFHFIQTKLKRRMTQSDLYLNSNTFAICDDGICEIRGTSGLIWLLRRMATVFVRTVPWYMKSVAKCIVPRAVRAKLRSAYSSAAPNAR